MLTADEIEGAHFVGKGEHKTVKRMLWEFDWMVQSMLDQATASHATSGRTLAPAMMHQLTRKPRSETAVEFASSVPTMADPSAPVDSWSRTEPLGASRGRAVAYV